MSGLDEKSREALVEYRLERAYATMDEAALLTEKEFYNAAVNPRSSAFAMRKP